MNEFKDSLKEEVNNNDIKQPLTDDEIKEIDKKIIIGIVETLSNMLKSSEDKNEQIQIMDRMLNINKMFDKGFDQEIKKLHKIEKSEKDTEKSSEQSSEQEK